MGSTVTREAHILTVGTALPYNKSRKEVNKMSGFEIIYTDPPWPQTKGNLRACRPNQGKSLDYSTMSIQEIVDLHANVFQKCADKHNIFMWTIDKYLSDTEKFMKELGYTLHARMIWDKGNGIAPAFTVRFSHEYLLWFYKKGHMLMPRRETRGKYTTVIRENATVHSHKPESVYHMIDDMFPDASKLEMFARNEKEGWESFGDQIGMFEKVM